jgi:hypothetical protein
VRIRGALKSITFGDSTIPTRGEAMMNDATLAEAVRKHIVLTLACCGGNRTHAAKILNISLRCLRNKLRGYANMGIGVAPAGQPKTELHSTNSPYEYAP